MSYEFRLVTKNLGQIVPLVAMIYSLNKQRVNNLL